MLNTMKRSRATMAVAAIALCLMAAAPVMAASSINVQKVLVSGAIVQVYVKNTASSPASGTVAVQAVVGGSQVWGYAPVTLSGGQCATVSVAFTSSPSKLMSVGISDNPTPF